MANRFTKRLLQTSVAALVMSSTAVPQVAYSQVEIPDPSSPSSPTASEPTRIQESNGTIVILPPFYDPQATYPAVVLLPYTGGTAEDFFEGRFSRQYAVRTASPFIVILPPGEGSVNDYNHPGAFDATIARHENLVRSDLATLTPKYNIDASRVVIGGYSLGGDLSWALSIRNPTLFRGTIVVGSLSSYRNATNMRQLADHSPRFFMIMGEQDERLPNMRSAVVELTRYGITHRFETVPGADHYNIFSQDPSQDTLMRGVDYTLFSP